MSEWKRIDSCAYNSTQDSDFSFSSALATPSPVKTSLDIEQLQCQEQCTDRTPYYPLGLSRAQFSRQPFSK